MAKRKPIEVALKNFWSRVNKTDSCWLWTGAVHGNGYGASWWNWKSEMAHRVSWMIAHDDVIPKGLSVLHSCDTPLCVNPDHLTLGTNKQNLEDAANKHRTSEFGQDILAKKYNVYPSTIHRIVYKRTWAHAS